jgi:hypothetical protein
VTRQCFATHGRLARPGTPEWHGRQASGVRRQASGFGLQASGFADDFALPGAVRSGNFTAGMELREFAERVVFGTTLEDKLFRPETFTDTRPGSAWESPVAPGRPDVLRFKAPGSATTTDSFPGLHRLDHGSERGKVLHFFANHELLATELMALVLLRFPDAPPAFRRGVLKTLQDEQDHVRLYLERMKACGVVFGELPVSGYFWRSVAPMRSPMDFVSGLSLTFEQANLDFSKTFGRAFAEAGCDLIDVSAGSTTPDAQPVYGRMFQTPFSDRIRNEAGVATMAVGNIYETDHVNSILAAGRADLCALARPHLADPNWSLRAAAELGWRGQMPPVQYLAGFGQLARNLEKQQLAGPV